jgi:hypothetical protein
MASDMLTGVPVVPALECCRDGCGASVREPGASARGPKSPRHQRLPASRARRPNDRGTTPDRARSRRSGRLDRCGVRSGRLGRVEAAAARLYMREVPAYVRRSVEAAGSRGTRVPEGPLRKSLQARRPFFYVRETFERTFDRRGRFARRSSRTTTTGALCHCPRQLTPMRADSDESATT